MTHSTSVKGSDVLTESADGSPSRLVDSERYECGKVAKRAVKRDDRGRTCPQFNDFIAGPF